MRRRSFARRRNPFSNLTPEQKLVKSAYELLSLKAEVIATGVGSYIERYGIDSTQDMKRCGDLLHEAADMSQRADEAFAKLRRVCQIEVEEEEGKASVQ